jgi:hypothetical protein
MTMTSTANADYEIRGGGTIFLLAPLNEKASEFLNARLGDEAQFFGDAVAVEHSFIMDIVIDLRMNGFIVR